MKHFILTKVASVSAIVEPKDLEKGLTHTVVLESTKRIGDIVVPDFIKSKSMLKLEVSAELQLLEVEIFNISGPNGGKVQTYYRVIRKADLGGKK